MIAHLRGTVLDKQPNQVIIDCAGVGYEVQIPISTYTAVPDTGSSVSLRIHTQVREDAIQLFGFGTADEKSIFERLISVNGIGPKLAITILSGLRTVDLIDAIRGGNVPQLVKIPGIGKKTAERMVLELKDKVIGIGSDAQHARSVDSGPLLNDVERDVVSALQNLGCTPATAQEALRKAQAKGVSESFESMFREALATVR